MSKRNYQRKRSSSLVPKFAAERDQAVISMSVRQRIMASRHPGLWRKIKQLSDQQLEKPDKILALMALRKRLKHKARLELIRRLAEGKAVYAHYTEDQVKVLPSEPDTPLVAEYLRPKHRKSGGKMS